MNKNGDEYTRTTPADAAVGTELVKRFGNAVGPFVSDEGVLRCSDVGFTISASATSSRSLVVFKQYFNESLATFLREVKDEAVCLRFATDSSGSTSEDNFNCKKVLYFSPVLGGQTRAHKDVENKENSDTERMLITLNPVAVATSLQIKTFEHVPPCH